MFTAVFLNLLLVGFAYFTANIISENFYYKLYPIIGDYLWANVIMFAVIYFGIAIPGSVILYQRYIRSGGG